MALSSDTPRAIKNSDYSVLNYVVKSGSTVYEGAALTRTAAAGTVNPLSTSEEFVGFADHGAAAGETVRVRDKGIIKLSVTGVNGRDNEGDTVYATDDGTFTLTASGGLAIGKVYEHVSSTSCFVYFEGAPLRSV